MLSDDEIIRAFRWALGVGAYESDEDLWRDFLKRSSSTDERRRIAQALGEMLERAALLRMGIVEGSAEQYEKDLVDGFFETVGNSENRTLQLIRKLKATLYPSRPRTPAPVAPAPKAPATPMKFEGFARFPARPSAPPPRAAEPSADTAPAEPPAAVETKSADEVPPGITLWKYVEILDATDLHPDFDARSFIPAASGFQFIGARVRGRRHKHEGSNCDDWFEAASAGRWDIVAVSDGVAAYRKGRVGAKVSTTTALGFLRRELAGVTLGLAGDASEEVLARNEQGAFLRGDLQRVQEILHEAVRLAHHAVAEEAEKRKVEATFLSGTLRLAVHSVVPGGEHASSFVLACGAGDGMSAAVDGSGRLHLLASEGGSGGYPGVVEFLTDPRTIDPARLAASTYSFLGPLRALMVMSDGVADPYFPNNPGMLRLFGDLIVNGVLAVPGVSEDAIGRTRLDLPKFSYLVDTPVSPTERLRARIRQSDRLAEHLGLSLEEILKWPPLLLLGGARGEPLTESFAAASAAERLRMWLDTFYLRGEFDDRTLVVLFRETGL